MSRALGGGQGISVLCFSPSNASFLHLWAYLEGQGDSVSRFITRITRATMLYGLGY